MYAIIVNDVIENLIVWDGDADIGFTPELVPDTAKIGDRKSGDGTWQAAEAGVAPVPDNVSPLQIRRALSQAGLLGQINNYASAQGGDVELSWEYATTILRTDPLINAGATALGMTTDQVDDMFRLAATFA